MKLAKILCLSILAFPALGFSSFAMQKNSHDAALEERLQPQLKLEPQQLYDYAVKLRKGEIVDYTAIETKKASFLCFREVFVKTQDCQDKTLLGKAAHNLGNIYYQWNQPQMAAKMYQIAEATGIKEAGRNLQRLQQQKVLPEPKKPNRELAQELENTQRTMATQVLTIAHIIDKMEEDFVQQMPHVMEQVLSTCLSRLGIEEHRSPKQIAELVQKASPSTHQYLRQKDQDTEVFLRSIATQDLLPLQKLKQKAEMTGLDRGDIDQISYEHLLSRTFTKSEIQESLFSLETLKENDRVAHQLKKTLTSGTLPIIIGRSCDWIMEHFKRHYPEQAFIKLPGSGLYNLMRQDNNFSPIVPETSRKAYVEFLKFYNLSSLIFKENRYDSITLVDRTETGDSIMALSLLLNEIDNRFDLEDNKLKKIGIISPNHANKFTFPTILVHTKALTETVKKHDFDQAKALSRAFNPSDWSQWRTFNFYPEPLPPAQARLQQIESFVKKK